jgi:paraquat-inducible protein B
MQQPTLKKKAFVSPVWFLPFIALCIGGWILYTSIQEAGVDIIIHFDSADGITPGKTKVIYKGIPVGIVRDVEVDDNLQGVNLHVEIDKRAKEGLVEDTKFWVVRPVVSAGRISGLDTLLSGSYIAVKSGKSSVHTTTFAGLENQPPSDADSPGLHITLITPALYSLQRGSYIYSKNLQIGQVEAYSLKENGMITLQVFIEPEFSHLIRKNTRFWNSSGLSVTGDLQKGLKVTMESMASLIYGGINCVSPEQKVESLPAESGRIFSLYKDFEDAEYGIPMTLQLASGDGIVAGQTKILYRGLKAGVVKSLDVNDDSFHTVTASILLDPRAEVILKQDTRFWVIRPQVSIEGIKNIETLISGAYITFQPGKGVARNNFVIESDPMPIPALRPGTHFFLQAKDSGSLTIGTPISFRKLVVGEITDISLAKDGKSVQTQILIYKPYDKFVQKNSIFWNVSGIQIDGNLSDFKVNLSSVRSMLAGGITFTNPSEDTGKESSADASDLFTLYEGYHEAVAHEASLQPDGLNLRLQSNDPGSIRIGSPVSYNNIKVGKVMRLGLAPDTNRIDIDLLIYEEARNRVNSSSKFYNISGLRAEVSLQGITLETRPLEAIVSGGIAFITPDTKASKKLKKIYTLYPSREEASNADSLHLSLRLHNGKGISKHTKIRYQGIEIGQITALHFDKALKQILAEVVIQEEAKSLFREDSVLYFVGPQISLSGVHNLDTVLSGSYISLVPGTGESAVEFTVLPAAPDGVKTYAGLNIILESESKGSLKPGSPIYYRKVPVGQVTGYELSPTAQHVWLSANIHPEYQHLVHRGTKFWEASGIEVSGGVLSGMTLSTESMEALIVGGISMSTPEGKEMGAMTMSGNHFLLHKKAEDGWKKWSPELTIPGIKELETSSSD